MEIFFTNFISLLLVEEVINMTSVCMATYNGERFIKEQIDSILCQLSPDDELIISDDESTDRTLDIIASYNDKRVKVLHHKHLSQNFYKNSKLPIVSFNFENALKQAKGDYIFLSDQDDIWLPNKVQSSLAALKTSNFALSNFSVIDDDGNLKAKKFYEKNPIEKLLLKNVLRPHFIGCCLCFDKFILQKILPFPKTTLSHDFWIGLVSLKFGKVTFIDEPLILHRVGKFNTSTACRASENSFLTKMQYRLLALSALQRRK